MQTCNRCHKPKELVCQIEGFCDDCKEERERTGRYVPKNDQGFYPLVAMNWLEVSLDGVEGLEDCITFYTQHVLGAVEWLKTVKPEDARAMMAFYQTEIDADRERYGPNHYVWLGFGDLWDAMEGEYLLYDQWHHDDGNPDGRWTLEELLAGYFNSTPKLNQEAWDLIEEFYKEINGED